MKTFKIASVFILTLFIILTSSYIYLVYKNNIDTNEPTAEELSFALNQSVSWILKNQEHLLKDNNPALWYFLDSSALITGNVELAQLVMKYRKTVLDERSVWAGYFMKQPPYRYISGQLSFMEDYQKFLVYGLTCNRELRDEKSIQDQLKSSFCNWKPYYSSCSTHQLMGIRLLQQNNCGENDLYNRLSDGLVNTIENQVTWDPRVGDVYIQRTLMLIESGNRDRVKPIWIRNILDEQRPDGGWANFYRIFNVTTEVEFGFGYKIPEFRKNPVSSFHTTAQAVYLLSLEYNAAITTQ